MVHIKFSSSVLFILVAAAIAPEVTVALPVINPYWPSLGQVAAPLVPKDKPPPKDPKISHSLENKPAPAPVPASEPSKKHEHDTKGKSKEHDPPPKSPKIQPATSSEKPKPQRTDTKDVSSKGKPKPQQTVTNNESTSKIPKALLEKDLPALPGETPPKPELATDSEKPRLRRTDTTKDVSRTKNPGSKQQQTDTTQVSSTSQQNPKPQPTVTNDESTSMNPKAQLSEKNLPRLPRKTPPKFATGRRNPNLRIDTTNLNLKDVSTKENPGPKPQRTDTTQVSSTSKQNPKPQQTVTNDSKTQKKPDPPPPQPGSAPPKETPHKTEDKKVIGPPPPKSSRSGQSLRKVDDYLSTVRGIEEERDSQRNKEQIESYLRDLNAAQGRS